ncbi:MAG: sarcosine oxidase, gamma subunit family protein [Gammaproteobacteria bacterium]|nr:sarcosine oxidase, gamma subunit family protein [Gammaproteobacteria bacterium]
MKVCWLGPNRWLVFERSRDEGASVSDKGSRLPSEISFVDTTGNYSVFSLSGSSVKRLLQKSCAYDFHESVFHTNSCVLTTFAKTQGLVVANENDGVELIVRRSYSDYVYRWIVDATREFGLAI